VNRKGEAFSTQLQSNKNTNGEHGFREDSVAAGDAVTVGIGFTSSAAARGRFAGELHPSSSSPPDPRAPGPIRFARGRATSSALDDARDPPAP
jgi:hypothetical protein